MIRVGVAGWDYPDWRGTVYPARFPHGFDRLAFLARFVDVLELNSSFYRPPDPRLAETWVRRTEAAAPTRFTAKAHRACTHEDAEPHRAAGPTLEGLRPLLEAGVLGAVLLQFPQRFRDTPESRDRLSGLLEAFGGWSPVVELRHASWDSGGAADWLRRHGAGWCVVDQPRVGHSTIGAAVHITSPVGYLRLHGRNASNWFRRDAGRDARYDYLYGTDELRSLAGTALQLGQGTAETFVVQNNHFRGQAVANALQLRHLIDGKRHLAPDDLVRTYPSLRDVTTVTQQGLF